MHWKKKKKAAPAQEKETEVEIPGGRRVKGVRQKFTVDNDDWIVYRLENGGIVKMKIIVEDIFVTKEEITPGTPLIAVKQGVALSYTPPEKGRTKR